MAKKEEKKIAYEMYVILQKTLKEIHEVTNVSMKTLSAWINDNDGAWKKERAARSAAPQKRISNLETILFDLAERRINKNRELIKAEEKADQEKVAEIKQEISRIDDAVSKWNKTLDSIKKDTRHNLTTYLDVMESVFKALQAYDVRLFMQTIAFQKKHANEASIKLNA